MANVATPKKSRCEDVAEALNIPLSGLVKTLAIVPETAEGTNTGVVLLLLRGDHDLNEIKAEKSGTIHKILVKSGQPVEFGQKLFLIKPS